MTRWVYSRNGGRLFNTRLELPYPVAAFENEPVVQAMHKATRSIGNFAREVKRVRIRDRSGKLVWNETVYDPPSGPWHEESAWAGKFTFEDGSVFRIDFVSYQLDCWGKAVLVLGWRAGGQKGHEEATVRRWLEGVNGDVRPAGVRELSDAEKAELVAYCVAMRDKPEFRLNADHVDRWNRAIKTILGEPGGMTLQEMRDYAVKEGWPAWQRPYEALSGKHAQPRGLWFYERTNPGQFQLTLRNDGPVDSLLDLPLILAMWRLMCGKSLGERPRRIGDVRDWAGEHALPDGQLFKVGLVFASTGRPRGDATLTVACVARGGQHDEAVVRKWVDRVNEMADGPVPTLLPPITAKPARRKRQAAPARDPAEEVAEYMIRGFHDWAAKEEYFLEPGIRDEAGNLKTHVKVCIHPLRDDWEDDARWSLDRWAKLGFTFEIVDLEHEADIVFDDERRGAFAERIFRLTGRRKNGVPVVHSISPRLINIQKSWRERHLRATLEHEIGHCLGLGHPGPYNASMPPGPAFAGDDKRFTIMSYLGVWTEELGPADRLGVAKIYGAALSSRKSTRMDRIVAATRTFKGRRTKRAGKPYVRNLRQHAGMPDITGKERDEAHRRVAA